MDAPIHPKTWKLGNRCFGLLLRLLCVRLPLGPRSQIMGAFPTRALPLERALARVLAPGWTARPRPEQRRPCEGRRIEVVCNCLALWHEAQLVVPLCVKSSLLRVDMGMSISWPYRVDEAIFVSHGVLAGGCFGWILAPVRDLVARLFLACGWRFRCQTFELQLLVN